MKRFLKEALIILGITTTVAFSFNYFQNQKIHVFSTYRSVSDIRLSRGAPDGLEDFSYQEIDSDFLEALLQDDSIILLDARDIEYYRQGHLPSALNLPLTDFERIYPLVKRQLKETEPIVTYCSSRTCHDAIELAARLFEKGHRNLLVYIPGYEEWSRLGKPVMTETSAGTKND